METPDTAPSNKPDNQLNYRMVIAYDGTNYSGWQFQKGEVKTIQGEINTALGKLFRTPIETVGASRTDAGVHAKGQVANFHSELSIEPARVKQALNGMLDHDIRIKHVDLVDPDFSSRFSTEGKRYRYRLAHRNHETPFERLYTTYYRHPLDLPAMQEAARLYLGEKDFVCLSCKSDNPHQTTVRNITRAEIKQVDDHLEYVVEGTAFLYKMVRCMVGCLLAVGQGRMTNADIETMFETGERCPKFSVAAPEGLCLEEVYYPQ